MHLGPGTVVAKKYRLDRMIARGGMGSVWVALDTQLEREVAVKFMEPHIASSPEARARFEREAKAAAALRTPHVVQIHDHGVDDDTAFIAMELLEGESLSTRLRRDLRISLPAAARVLTQASRALRKAHEAGIVHRDLKPGNIFMTRADDDEEVVKVLDFGIAKAGTAPIGDATKTGELLGSPHYMSPEQSRGLRTVDHRSDLWSMGVIVYRAITGELPFPGDALGDVIYRICSEPPAKATSLLPGAPAALDAFFDRALARDPAQRFASAREMAQAFAEIVAAHSPDSAVDVLSGSFRRTPPAAGSNPSSAGLGDPTPSSLLGRPPLPLAPQSAPNALSSPAMELTGSGAVTTAAAQAPFFEDTSQDAGPGAPQPPPSGPYAAPLSRHGNIPIPQDLTITNAGHTLHPTPGLRPAVLWAAGGATVGVILLASGILLFAGSSSSAPIAPASAQTAAPTEATAAATDATAPTAAPSGAPAAPSTTAVEATPPAAPTSAPAKSAAGAAKAPPPPPSTKKKKPSFGY